jgi:uncharacterized protein involved in type VI secretion and phage assembly
VPPLFDLASVFADQIGTAEAERARVFEPVIGVVTDNKDPQKLGRVKLKFPFLSEQDSTWWAPVVMLGAGNRRGWFFIPEINDEVLVLFEHGDIGRPVVIGSLWNGRDKPPHGNPGGNPRRVIKSRQGSRIVFDDESDVMILEDGARSGRITFDANAKTITIEALEGDVCIQSPKGTMTIVAKQVELKAGQNVELHAGSGLRWNTEKSATVDAGASVTLSGSNVHLKPNAKPAAPAAPTASPKPVDDPYGS